MTRNHLALWMDAPDAMRSLSALRVFEAAARLGSFQAAADSLHLTPSAVSHQVRRLEANLGVALFIRSNRLVKLTERGRMLEQHVAMGLAEIVRGVRVVQAAANATPLRLSVAPSFASTYLNSRVEQFEAANPGLLMQLDFSHGLVDLEIGNFDIAIRHSISGKFPHFSEKLIDVRVAPVCSPAVAARLAEGAELDSMTRLSMVQAPNIWSEWLRASGSDDVMPVRELHFDTLVDALQAAIDGMGILIAPLAMLEKHFQTRLLVRPYDAVVERASAYYLLCRKGEETSRKILLFRDWLRTTVQNCSP